MKFGAQIKSGLYAEWQQYYIQYSELKKFLKKRQEAHAVSGSKKDSSVNGENGKGSNWDDTDEAEFIKKLQEELQKVSRFQEDKVAELHGQIELYSKEVQRLVDAKNSVGKEPEHNEDEGRTRDAQRQTSTSSAAGSTVVGSEATVRPVAGDDEENTQSHIRHSYGSDVDDSDDDDEIPEDEEEIERRFGELEEDLEVLIADVYDLGRFTHLNYTGFIKIVKKHDKRTGWELKGDFVRQYLEKRPFYRENYDALIVQLSRLYNLVRTRGNPVQGDSAAGGGQSAFVRQTTKYWVHPDNYVNLKLAVLKHLPVLVFDPDKPFEQRDAAISSIYFDNEPLDLYLGWLEKSEGAEAIRLRWYGDMGIKQIFVERKTHREDWTGEKSVKARFPIKEDQVNDYLSGKLKMDETFEALRKKGKKSDKEIDSMIRLAREVQERVLEKKLQPVMRTFYNRTAFQLPGDARVRISFDTNLTLVREDNWDGSRRAGPNWRRMDIGIDWPFEQLPKADRELFPYGVLEVKLQTQMGQEPPEWVRELVSSHLVEAVPKFSKFIHGCATLLPNRVDLVPFWLPQMETDIRKPVSAKKAALIERPVTSSASHTPTTTSDTEPQAPSYTEPLSEDEDGGEDEDDTRPATSERPSAAAQRQTKKAGSYTEPTSDDDDDDDDDSNSNHGGGDPMRRAAIDEFGVAGIPKELQAQAEEAKTFREKNRESASLLQPPDKVHGMIPGQASSSYSNTAQEEVAQAAAANGLKSETTKLTPKNLKKMLEQKYGGGSGDSPAAGESGAAGAEGAPEQQGPEYVTSFRMYNGKRIAVPVRVEPKVNFALERTLLAWVEFSVLISAIGVGLLNFTGRHDAVGFSAAITFTIIALIAIAYSGAMFLYRAIAIRRRRAISYEDKYGPTLLVTALVLATSINFGLRFSELL